MSTETKPRGKVGSDKPNKKDYWLPPGDGDAGPYFAESEYEAALELYYNTNLKPCPFCGTDAVMKQTGRKEITIKCPECVIKYVQKVKHNSLDWLKDKMMGSWNKRVPITNVNEQPKPTQ